MTDEEALRQADSYAPMLEEIIGKVRAGDENEQTWLVVLLMSFLCKAINALPPETRIDAQMQCISRFAEAIAIYEAEMGIDYDSPSDALH